MCSTNLRNLKNMLVNCFIVSFYVSIVTIKNKKTNNNMTPLYKRKYRIRSLSTSVFPWNNTNLILKQAVNSFLQSLCFETDSGFT